MPKTLTINWRGMVRIASLTTGTSRLQSLQQLAGILHEDQVDQSGVPYIEHVRAVAAGVTSESARAVALFHDALEDARATTAALGVVLTSDELAAVQLLTRDKTIPYADYIDTIATAPGVDGDLAREVKRADLAHNLGRLTPELERLRARYVAAVERLA